MTADWTNEIRRGDVLKTPSGDFRIVRDVTHHEVRRGVAFPHVRTTVTFAIRSCSWTKRCYTVLNGSDLRSRGFSPTGVRMRLTSKLDREIDREIFERHWPKDIRLHCCDVVGAG